MATLKASFAQVSVRSLTGGTMPIPLLSSAVRLNALTTSGTSQIVQLGGSDWAAPRDGFVLLVCDGDIDVAAGTAPVASATAGVTVRSGVAREFGVLAGEKLAVINAA